MNQCFFHQYPYGNLHELNLDWILSKIKELTLNNEEFYKNVHDRVIEYLDAHATELIASLSFGKVNVKAFGAYGDGLHDDSPFIQMALESLPYGGTLYFPPGTFLISETINLPDIKKVSMELDNATIKQLHRLEPMIKVASGDPGDNLPQSVYGDGTIEMDSLGGVGIQITNNGTYASIRDVQVRHCSNGIGVLMGDTLDGKAVSLQAELNNVKIYGTDSAMQGTALYVNAYDCVFNNLYLYLCRIGCQTNHGGHNFDFVHVWVHSYNTWIVDEFEKTIGFKMKGSAFFGTLYLDSVYTGLQTNGYDQLINTCYYTSDIDEGALSNEVGRVIEKMPDETVIIDKGLLYNPHNYKMKVFHINNQESVSSVTIKRNCQCKHIVQSSKIWLPYDEANNIGVNNNARNPVKRSLMTENIAYKIGYIKLSESSNVTFNFQLKGNYSGTLTTRILPEGFDTHNTHYKLNMTSSIAYHLYYGAREEHDGIYWLPIYMMAESSVIRIPIVECYNIGDSGFYPCYESRFEDLDTADVLTLTEITPES